AAVEEFDVVALVRRAGAAASAVHLADDDVADCSSFRDQDEGGHRDGDQQSGAEREACGNGCHGGPLGDNVERDNVEATGRVAQAMRHPGCQQERTRFSLGLILGSRTGTEPREFRRWRPTYAGSSTRWS